MFPSVVFFPVFSLVLISTCTDPTLDCCVGVCVSLFDGREEVYGVFRRMWMSKVGMSFLFGLSVVYVLMSVCLRFAYWIITLVADGQC